MCKLVLSSAFLTVLIFAEGALACDKECGPIEDRLGTLSEVMFFGRLVSQQPDEPLNYTYRRMEFEVLVGFKGVDSTRIELFTVTGGSFGECSFFASTGEEVFVYASNNIGSSRFFVDPCSPKESSGAAASEEMAAVRALGFEPLELKPENGRQDLPCTGTCGCGILSAALGSMCLLTCIRQQVRMPKRRRLIHL